MHRRLLATATAACCLAAAGCTPNAGAGAPVAVPSLRETPPVNAAGDAADDPAIWVAEDPALSVVIATQKKGGLYVYDLSAKVLQPVPGGRPNNVDLRPGFAWKSGPAPIVGASDRGDNSLVFWRFDPGARRLVPTPAGRIATGFKEVYGFCLGRHGGEVVAVATDKTSGDIGVWRIGLDAAGALTGKRIVAFSIGSITEGCVIDDARDVLYLADELHGIWEVPLGASDGAGRRMIDRVAPGGHLAADVEGLSLWAGADGKGWLVASVQGQSRYAVYDRQPPHAYRGSFRLTASRDGKVDAVSGTDGIDIVSASLGPDFPQGLMVAQDDENTDPAASQDFKFVSWAEVAGALKLKP